MIFNYLIDNNLRSVTHACQNLYRSWRLRTVSPTTASWTAKPVECFGIETPMPLRICISLQKMYGKALVAPRSSADQSIHHCECGTRKGLGFYGRPCNCSRILFIIKILILRLLPFRWFGEWRKQKFVILDAFLIERSFASFGALALPHGKFGPIW